jgi:hypothetical protein
MKKVIRLTDDDLRKLVSEQRVEARTGRNVTQELTQKVKSMDPNEVVNDAYKIQQSLLTIASVIEKYHPGQNLDNVTVAQISGFRKTLNRIVGMTAK